MLHRKSSAGLIVITQPAHSWLSGQLARAWGNSLFGQVEPAEAVALAAGLHDVGFLEWEQSPTLNPKTGRPYSFMELPTALHLEIWSRGIEQMKLLNRYAALLVSLHYSGLAQRHPVTAPPEEVQQQQDFLQEQRRVQAALLATLKNDAFYGPYASNEIIERNRRLIAIWDWLSLLLGLGSSESARIEEVPAHKGSLALEFVPLQKPSPRVRLTPWPFQTPSLHLDLEGRRLANKFTDEAQMRDALLAAPVEAISIVLTSG